MNRSESSNTGEDNLLASTLRRKFGKKTVGGAAIVLLVGAYSFIQPTLNARLGWNLPALRQDSGGRVVADSAKANNRTNTVATKSGSPAKNSRPASDAKTGGENSKSPQAKPKPSGDAASTTKSNTPAAPNKKSGPLADRLRPTQQQKANGTRGSPTTSPVEDKNLRYGLLRDIGRDRYMSPAGLQYGPGSQEGHRLEHLRRHTKDIPNRKGSHGVFDGDMEGALKTIDAAYERAKKGQQRSSAMAIGRSIQSIWENASDSSVVNRENESVTQWHVASKSSSKGPTWSRHILCSNDFATRFF